MERVVSLILILVLLLTGCSNDRGSIEATSSFFAADYVSSFDNVDYVPAVRDINSSSQIDFLYEDICFSEEDVNPNGKNFLATAAVCFDVDNAEIIYSQNMYSKIYPASTTKLLTAICALKYGSPDMVYTVTRDRCGVNNYGASLVGLMAGDVISMDELMYCLLLHSGNDAAVAIAECVSGTEKDFVDLMNREAANIGCINTHFANSHGLQHVDHYSTAYDMYLIFNESLKYDKILEIFGTAEHTAHLETVDGKEKTIELVATNLYSDGLTPCPEGIEVIGGKTGSTPSAGKCLIIYARRTRDKHGFITMIFKADTTENLYNEMNELLNMCLA